MLTGKLIGWDYDAFHKVVWGHLINDIHTRWKEGTYVHTSEVLSPKPEEMKEGAIIKTRNSTYELGPSSKDIPPRKG